MNQHTQHNSDKKPYVSPMLETLDTSLSLGGSGITDESMGGEPLTAAS